jgi:hypothetical protein
LKQQIDFVLSLIRNRPFIANPSLLEKLKKGLPFKDSDGSTFYPPVQLGTLTIKLNQQSKRGV